ncbi:MAG: acyl carrier protein [Acidimicrobiales bacterium]|nr:acyl carrier protein [Acidimicrobiales bacterium]
MSDNAVFERFRKCAVEVLNVQPDQITVDARFGDDLDADSLDLVELMMALEEEFGIEQIPEEELADVGTVGQALELIQSKL